jgi:moderate conductance mechanosensitive channel
MVGAQASWDNLKLWLFNEGFNLLKITLVALILVRLLRWTTDRASKLVQSSGDDAHDKQRRQQVHTMASVLNSLGTALVVALALATALREFGLDVRPTLAGAGILGVTIGLGAQNLVRDVLNGMFILLDNQFGIGDVIRTNAITGQVETMTLRRTVIRDGEGAAHSIPNGEIRIVANLTRTWSRVSFLLPVASNQPVDRVLEILGGSCRDLAAMPEFSTSLIEPPRALGVEQLAGREMQILLQVRVQAGRQADVGRAWRRLIKKAFEEAGVPFQDLRELAVEAKAEATDCASTAGFGTADDRHGRSEAAT